MKRNHSLKTIFFISILLFFCAVLLILFLFLYRLANTFSSPPTTSTSQNLTHSQCPITYKQFEVQGVSLSPILSPGDNVTLAEGYYSCNQIERNDLVIYQYAGNRDPLVKIVRALPGDNWSLQEVEDGFLIVVNGAPLKSSEGNFYTIPPSHSRLLALYTTTYPTIPQDAYLLMGNNPSGTLDATQFGLVSKEDILGKVTKN